MEINLIHPTGYNVDAVSIFNDLCLNHKSCDWQLGAKFGAKHRRANMEILLVPNVFNLYMVESHSCTCYIAIIYKVL